MIRDPSPEVRSSAALHLGMLSRQGRAEEVERVLAPLLWDEDESVRKRALSALAETYELHDPAERAERVEHLAAEIAGDPRTANEILDWSQTRTKVKAEDAQRFLDMTMEDDITLFGGEGYSERSLRLLYGPYLIGEGDPQEIVGRLCLRLLTDSPEDDLRRRALEILREPEHETLLPQLTEIARSGQAASVEQALTETIHCLQHKASLPSLTRRVREANGEEDARE